MFCHIERYGAYGDLLDIDPEFVAAGNGKCDQAVGMRARAWASASTIASAITGRPEAFFENAQCSGGDLRMARAPSRG